MMTSTNLWNRKRANTHRHSPAARKNQDYAIACCTILFLQSLMVLFFLITRPPPVRIDRLVGSKAEGFTIWILITFWSALVSIVSDPRNGLATDSSESISSGNVYYFSWAGLVTGVALMLSYIQSVWGTDIPVELRNRAKRLEYWVWLGIIGSIQMGSCARSFDNHWEYVKSSIQFCKRCRCHWIIERHCFFVSGGNKGW